MALSRAGMTREAVRDAAHARQRLADRAHAPPHMILVDAAMVELEPLVAWLRGEARHFGAVVVAVVPAPSDGAFGEAIAAGCDDVVVQGDLGALTRRAAALSNYDATARPPTTQGRAVVAHPSMHRRRILGRALRLGGFDVSFAEVEKEFEAFILGHEVPTLCVVAEDLPPSGAVASVKHAHESGASVPTVIVGTDSRLGALRGLGAIEPVALLSEQAPPDRLLFVANELLRPGVQELRASRRVLWDAMCAFRPAGQLHPVLGLTYNLSREGLYVRTLDPPPRDVTLWFELRPPGAREAVHLRGTVVWVRNIENGPGGAAPPGFGVRIDEEACPPADLRRYHDHYEQLVERPRMVA